MDEKQLLYAVEIASSPDAGLRQQANDFLRDVAAQPDRYWTVRSALLHPLVHRLGLNSILGEGEHAVFDQGGAFTTAETAAGAFDLVLPSRRGRAVGLRRARGLVLVFRAKLRLMSGHTAP
jgi:hypothetical protein